MVYPDSCPLSGDKVPFYYPGGSTKFQTDNNGGKAPCNSPPDRVPFYNPGGVSKSQYDSPGPYESSGFSVKEHRSRGSKSMFDGKGSIDEIEVLEVLKALKALGVSVPIDGSKSMFYGKGSIDKDVKPYPLDNDPKR